MKQIIVLFVITTSCFQSLGQAKFDWIKKIGETGTDCAGLVVNDSNGYIYVVGSFVGQITFGTDVLQSTNAANASMFLAKYDSNGNALWGKKLPINNANAIGDCTYIKFKKLKLSQSGRLYLIGVLDYGGFPYGFTTSIRADGSVMVHTEGLNVQYTDIVIDSIDNTIVVGNYGTGFFISKSDSLANPKWAYLQGTNAEAKNVQYVNGEVYVGGQFKYQLQLTDTVGSSPIPLTATYGINDWDLFIAKYSSNGQLLSGHNDDGLSPTTSTGMFNYTGDFTKNADWNVTWFHEPTSGLNTVYGRKYAANLANLYNASFLSTSCVLAFEMHFKNNAFKDQSFFSYVAWSCVPQNGYLLNNSFAIVDSLWSPHISPVPWYLPTRDFSIDKNDAKYVTGEFDGSFQYYDSTGLKTITSTANTRDIYLAKMYTCPVYSPQITSHNNTLFCSLPGLQYQWFQSGSAIPGATGQSYLPTADGDYTVSVSDSRGCGAVSGTFNITLSIKNVSTKSTLEVYPNPVTSTMQINGLNNPTKITISNILGNTVLTKTVLKNEKVDISTLAKGIYTIMVDDSVLKIVKL